MDDYCSIEAAVQLVEECAAHYNNPTDWDYGAIDACHVIAKQLRALQSSDPFEDLREEVSQAMAETAPSWGWRINRVLGILGLDFGTPESIEWGMLRDHHRVIRWDEDALAAANADKDFPPLRWMKSHE